LEIGISNANLITGLSKMRLFIQGVGVKKKLKREGKETIRKREITTPGETERIKTGTE
jgi:hypothetical protein